MLRLAELIEENAEELAMIDSLEAGKPITDCREADLPESIKAFRWYAEAADKLYDSIAPTGRDALGMIIREPIGVVGAVLPWNFPLMMAAWKVAPSLTAGNSVDRQAGRAHLALDAPPRRAGRRGRHPRGRLQRRPRPRRDGGPGARAPPGRRHGLVHRLDRGRAACSCATRRRATSRRSSSSAAGKSPQVVMADAADLDLVAENVVLAGFANMGENCTCGSRLIVHRSVRDELLERIVAKTAEWPVGDPQDPATKIGPMIEGPHLLKVLGYIGAGREEGARVVVGGNRVLPETGGYFVEPTVFDGVDNTMTIAREEIFGPVISTIVFDAEDEGLALANATNYGLHAAVYTNDLDTAVRAARTLRAGTVSVNAYSEGDITTPFGGFKESGFGGRDKGLEAFDQYTEKKTVWISVKP